MSIFLSKVSKNYGQQKALDEISFEIKGSQVVGLLGLNGAGKSTLMKILTTAIVPDAGEVKVFDLDYKIKNQSLRAKKHIGYLSEKNPLYGEMYVLEYLRFHAKIHRISKAAIQHVIQKTGLKSEIRKKIHQLSKGYQQRVGLAAAIVHDPKVLILDEPTTGLDPNQIQEFRALIRSLSTDKIVLLSTHIMQEVEAICDRAIVINKGTVVADKNLNELKNSGTQSICVAFDYRVEAAHFKSLPYLIGVTNAKGLEYELQFDTPIDMRPKVFDFAKQMGLKIVQLYRKHQNLEQLFQNLTSD